MSSANAPNQRLLAEKPPPPPLKPLQSVDVTAPPARRVLRRTETHSQRALKRVTRQLAAFDDAPY